MNRIRTLARLSAFAAISFIAFVTLSPIGLRPVVTGIHTEHLFAFAIVGALFGVGYPRHLLIAATLVIALAAGLEALQNLAPGRHGRLIDMDMKIAGTVIGFALAAIWNAVQKRRQSAFSAEAP